MYPLSAWAQHLPTTMNSLFTMASAFLTQLQRRTEGGGERVGGRPSGPTCHPPTSSYHPTRRTVLTDDTITLHAWPSSGGGLDRLTPPLRRLADQGAEGSLCKRLLLLGAKWWESEARYDFIIRLSMFDSHAINDVKHDRGLFSGYI